MQAKVPTAAVAAQTMVAASVVAAANTIGKQKCPRRQTPHKTMVAASVVAAAPNLRQAKVPTAADAAQNNSVAALSVADIGGLHHLRQAKVPKAAVAAQNTLYHRQAKMPVRAPSPFNVIFFF